MARVRNLPLGDKLLVVGVASSALALVAASLIFLLSNFLAARANIRNELRLQGAIIAENTAPSLMFRSHATAAETVAALRVTGVDIACLYDAESRLFASHLSPGAGPCPAAPPDERKGWLRDIDARLPVEFKGTQYGSLYLSSSFSDFWSRMGSQFIAALAGIGLGVVVAVLLSRWVQRIIAEPIVDLSETAGRIARAGDYSLRAVRKSQDEIGELVDSFNQMVSEVERRDDQLRAASRLKDEFLAALSHELRTPLNAVLGWIQVLRTTRADSTTVSRAYESIERNARAQARLIEDLLDISRIVSGKLHVRPEAVDLVAIIESAVEVVRPSAEAKHIAFSRRLLPSPQLVLGDPQRLQQIAWNLLSNAIKFTSQGGRVVVSLEDDGDHYRFEVQDNGIGISPEFLPHVFERFRQADGSITRRHGGLGLGLAIARELTELHGGRIRAMSDGDQTGATFVVTLPKATARAAAVPPDRDADPQVLEGLSVLVVDDDRDAKELASALLSAGGARVRTASTAEDALQALSSERFDVLLCDLAMPGTDGYQLMRQIRAESDAGYGRMPAVALSAYAGNGAESRARESGFDGFVAKPYSVPELLTAIRDAIGRAA